MIGLSRRIGEPVPLKLHTFPTEGEGWDDTGQHNYYSTKDTKNPDVHPRIEVM
jgi:hypothetical protein